MSLDTIINNNPTEKVKLQSADNRIFEVDIQVAKMLGTVKSILESGVRDNTAVISLPRIKGEILEMVLQWAEYHKNDDPHSADRHNQPQTGEIIIPPWDAQFLNVRQVTLCAILQAANDLDMRGLVELSAKTVAKLIVGKTAQEIRETFGIQNDISPTDDAPMNGGN